MRLESLNKREALLLVAAVWVIFSVIAAIPYVYYGLTPLNALFEAVSGITTTGASVLTGIAPRWLIFWRAFTQWIGGLGIIILFIAILPQFAVAGRQMFFAEIPGPTEDKITPRIKNTAKAFWGIYFGLTVIQIAALMLAGMPGFDAVCNSLSTISTGGFSTGDRNGLTDGIMTVFMFLGGTSFILLYNVLRGKNPLRSEEFRVYLGIIIIMSFLISPYQVISVITSTGSAPIAGLDFSAKVLLFVLMFIGACSTSTGGGIKITRWLIVFKTMKVELKRILHPHAVFNIKIDNKTLPQEVIGQTIMFVCFYFAILGVSAVLIGLLEQNAAAAVMGSVSTLGNIGLVENCASFQPLTKVIMIINMLVGRLELIPFLALFNRT